MSIDNSTGEFITLNGRYKLIERIGAGGMSLVYKAQDLSLGRMVAVKMLHDSLTGDDSFLDRFRREAHAAANLTHPNIVTVHDIGQDGNKHFIVMEFVDGITLKQLIREQQEKGNVIPIDRALNIAIQTCAGIGYAHRSLFVHCDIKPHNILITPDDKIKVADFGIARAISQVTASQDSKVWGTPQYFSPEQAAGESASPASDVYSIGVVLYELLSGKLPFEAETPTAMAIKHIREQPPLLTDVNPTVPQQLASIIKKILSKEPSGRYRTAGQLGRILRSYQENSMAQTQHITPTPKPIAEQETQVYINPSRPLVQVTEPPPAPRKPIQQKPAAKPAQRTPRPKSEPLPIQQNITDWTAITLSITALIALLGLIPLWFFVYQAWSG